MKSTIHKGLDGIVVAETEISSVDGEHGELVYAGFSLEELIARQCSYEDVLFLLLRKRLPSLVEKSAFAENLASRRTLSAQLEAFIDAIPSNLDYMDALRTGISALSCEVSTTYPPTEEQALDCIAKAPLILSRFYRRKTGQDILSVHFEMSHAENYLYLLTGKDPSIAKNKAFARALEIYFICIIEHGMNASTFTARVSNSTRADLISSITAAMSTLKGPLHGGAPLEVIHMLNSIGTKENAESWIQRTLNSGGRLMGFGHRVYTTYDPRAKVLQEATKELPKDGNDLLELSQYVEEVAIRILKERKPNNKLYTNVEFGAATILRAIGLPEELYPATFGISRCGGWAAHILEASKPEHQRLIRPQSNYVGNWPLSILARKDAEARTRAEPLVEESIDTAPSSEFESVVKWVKHRFWSAKEDKDATAVALTSVLNAPK